MIVERSSRYFFFGEHSDTRRRDVGIGIVRASKVRGVRYPSKRTAVSSGASNTRRCRVRIQVQKHPQIRQDLTWK